MNAVVVGDQNPSHVQISVPHRPDQPDAPDATRQTQPTCRTRRTRRNPANLAYNPPPMAWWLWLLLGLVLAALELASTGGFYLIFFGVSAMFIGLMGAIGLAGPPWLQWLVFTLLSVILLLAFRRPILRMMNVETGPVDSLVGADRGRRWTRFGPGAIGRAELRGSTWSARNLHSADLARGQRCRVERVDGLMLFLLPE